MKNILIIIILTTSTGFSFQSNNLKNGDKNERLRPNILIAISDNQSYPHAGAYGDKSVNTPGFDYVAEKGILFRNAFSSSPGCAPSRASIVTGRYPWQNEEAGGHQTLYPAKYITFPRCFRGIRIPYWIYR